MPKIRGNPSQKWVRRASVAGEDYAAGVQSPRVSWQAATIAAAGSWATGVQQAVTRGAFGRGVQAAGDARWQGKALSKGVARFPSGVAEAEQDYATRVAPYFAVIESIQLPPRGPKGDPRNIQRVSILAAALRARKVGTGNPIGTR